MEKVRRSPLLKFWKEYRLLGVSLVNGAVIMVFELIGARVIAPFLGSSSFVWTSIIGVILLALSLGYYYGGVLADQGASRNRLAQILLLAAVFILISRLIRDDFLQLMSGFNTDVRLKSFLAALVLFSPASLLMGMVSPYIARLQLHDMRSAGKTVGSIYAAGTVGSILGTFLYGYWLVAVFPNSAVHSALAVIMVLLSVAVSDGRDKARKGAAALGLAAVAVMTPFIQTRNPAVELDTDTKYSRVIVQRTAIDGRPARLYYTEAGRAQSGIYLDGDRGSAFEYVQLITEQLRSMPRARILMIGGGTFTLASDIARMDPAMGIDVVEIDPALTGIARRYFYYQDTPQIKIHNQDGREFLQHAAGRYDVIIVDAYTVNGPPFQLATIEAVRLMREHLQPDGAVIVNLIASYEGQNARLLEAVYATYQKEFSRLGTLPASSGRQGRQTVQNILLYAGNAGSALPAAAAEFQPSAAAQILTDDFAPVEYYTAQAIR